MDSHCFKLHRAYLISFNLSNVGEIFWVKSERTLSKVWKKIHFYVVFTDSINRACEIRKFHVAARQQPLRNAQKSVMHVQSCSFANLNPSLFAVRRRRCKKLPVVVIHKFCYHGNVTSHFSYTLRAVEKLKYLRLCSHFTGLLLRRYESHTDRASLHTKKGDFGVIYVTERSYAPRRSPKWKVISYGVRTIPESVSCPARKATRYSLNIT